jgi:hypothetical protein
VIVGSTNPTTPSPTITNLANLSTNQVAALGTAGKYVSGKDRLGNEWSIRVTGPGYVVVTDATPNDGVLDDDLDTIQIVGSKPNSTRVSGGVSATSLFQVPDSGLVLFNKLIAQTGVKSIVLNGFVLTQTVQPPVGALPNSNTGVYLAQGAGQLEFTGITALVDLNQATQPVNLVIGDPNIPLHVKPKIRIATIENTVYSSAATIVPTTPPTTPTVNLLVNGDIGSLNLVSSTQQTIPASQQFFFPIVGTTGRTAIQTSGIDHLNFTGAAVNVTVSRTAVPFSGSFTGLNHIGTATFGGTADGLAIDVKGKIGGLRFAKGLGSPTSNSNLPANYGVPYANTGYPANGLIGGAVSASSIGHVNAGASSTALLQSNDPNLQQAYPGEPLYFTTPGASLSSVVIATEGNIGAVNVLGNLYNSEIKSGFSLQSFANGFTGTTGPSSIHNVKINGTLVNSVVSATYTPSPLGYGQFGSAAGPGTIKGHLHGSAISTGQATVLGNTGAGFFARHKKGYLPAG